MRTLAWLAILVGGGTGICLALTGNDALTCVAGTMAGGTCGGLLGSWVNFQASS